MAACPSQSARRAADSAAGGTPHASSAHSGGCAASWRPSSACRASSLRAVSTAWSGASRGARSAQVRVWPRARGRLFVQAAVQHCGDRPGAVERPAGDRVERVLDRGRRSLRAQRLQQGGSGSVGTGGFTQPPPPADLVDRRTVNSRRTPRPASAGLAIEATSCAALNSSSGRSRSSLAMAAARTAFTEPTASRTGSGRLTAPARRLSPAGAAPHPLEAGGRKPWRAAWVVPAGPAAGHDVRGVLLAAAVRPTYSISRFTPADTTRRAMSTSCPGWCTRARLGQLGALLVGTATANWSATSLAPLPPATANCPSRARQAGQRACPDGQPTPPRQCPRSAGPAPGSNPPGSGLPSLSVTLRRPTLACLIRGHGPARASGWLLAPAAGQQVAPAGPRATSVMYRSTASS